MLSDSVWITGCSRSGKTTRLLLAFGEWVQTQPRKRKSQQQSPGALVMAANEERRRQLADRLATAYQGKYPVTVKTPLGFFDNEVCLYFPLLIESLGINAQFPLRLRPETEQDLATKLWRDDLELGKLQQMGVNEYRGVRRLLDLWQLAACSGLKIDRISSILESGLREIEGSNWQWVETLLLKWRNWCLERSLLTYSLICELYVHHLLPHPIYQQQLHDRYGAIFADDVDEYPAIAKDLCDKILDFGGFGAFTFNSDGAVRLGLNADPDCLELLKQRCRVESLDPEAPDSLLASLGSQIIEIVTDTTAFANLPVAISSIQTTSRGQLFKETVEFIDRAIKAGEIQPDEIAIVTPGLDAIARYTLTQLLHQAGIAVESTGDRPPLISSPTIRALLTLLALIYPGLGRLIDKDAVAEMLVVLSYSLSSALPSGKITTLPEIDPIRAGLIVDSCYCPDLELPKLLPVTAFPRWDRLGYKATTAYERILKWIEEQRSPQQMHLIPSFVVLLDRAIQEFLWNGSYLPSAQLTALRGLMETAQHYLEVEKRLQQQSGTIARFIVLLQQGTITANPYPISYLEPPKRAITLATIFQYRSRQGCHKWQFWLDAGSTLWLSGGAATLFGAPLFLRDNVERAANIRIMDSQAADEQRLERILRDLLARTTEKVYLCHSDLSTDGREQIGPLLSLVNAAMPAISSPLK